MPRMGSQEPGLTFSFWGQKSSAIIKNAVKVAKSRQKASAAAEGLVASAMYLIQMPEAPQKAAAVSRQI